MGDMVEEMDQKRRKGLAVIAGRRFLDDSEPQRTQSGLEGRSHSYRVGMCAALLSSAQGPASQVPRFGRDFQDSLHSRGHMFGLDGRSRSIQGTRVALLYF